MGSFKRARDKNTDKFSREYVYPERNPKTSITEVHAIELFKKNNFRPLRTVEQSVLSSFRVGDWRIGLKERMNKSILPPCPMCSSISLTLPHFLIWCPVLDKVRRISGVHAFMVENHFLKGFSEQEAIKLYLDAKGNEMKTVRERGKAIILMRNDRVV